MVNGASASDEGPHATGHNGVPTNDSICDSPEQLLQPACLRHLHTLSSIAVGNKECDQAHNYHQTPVADHLHAVLEAFHNELQHCSPLLEQAFRHQKASTLQAASALCPGTQPGVLPNKERVLYLLKQVRRTLKCVPDTKELPHSYRKATASRDSCSAQRGKTPRTTLLSNGKLMSRLYRVHL